MTRNEQLDDVADNDAMTLMEWLEKIKFGHLEIMIDRLSDGPPGYTIRTADADGYCVTGRGPTVQEAWDNELEDSVPIMSTGDRLRELSGFGAVSVWAADVGWTLRFVWGPGEDEEPGEAVEFFDADFDELVNKAFKWAVSQLETGEVERAEFLAGWPVVGRSDEED